MSDVDNTMNTNPTVTTEPVAGGLNVTMDQSAEEHAQKLQEEQDLRKLQDEIRMLKQVLADKIEQARVLRTNLGIATPLDSIENATRGIEQNINRFAEDVAQTDAFKKTSDVLQDVGKTTVSAFSMVGNTISSKLNSEAVTNIGAKASQFGSSILDSVSNLTKPTPRDFNEGNN